jgi:hypothetical protein
LIVHSKLPIHAAQRKEDMVSSKEMGMGLGFSLLLARVVGVWPMARVAWRRELSYPREAGLLFHRLCRRPDIFSILHLSA